MHSEKTLPQFVYKLMLVAATMIWGVSFVVMKDAVAIMEPSWLIGVRFAFTGVLLTFVFWKRIRAHWNRQLLIYGCVLGVLLFAGYWSQTVGLKFTTPGKNAFLTAVYCVIVPFLTWIITKRKPTIFNILAGLLCVAGVGFVSLSNETLSLSFGDGMTLICSLMFAAHIVATYVVAKNADIMALTVVQFWAASILGCAFGFITEPMPRISDITPEFMFNMAYLVILASCVAIAFQNAGVAHVPPSQAAILLSLESVFGVISSVLLINEQLTFSLVFGFGLILGAVILSEAFPLKKPPEEIDEAIVEDAIALD